VELLGKLNRVQLAATGSVKSVYWYNRRIRKSTL